MQSSVRIASLIYPAPVAGTPTPPPWGRFAEIRQVVERSLPGVTASLFAQPETACDGSGAIDWYSNLAGQPIPLLDLPDTEQGEARRRLSDRLHAVARLAEELALQDPPDHDHAQLLTQALHYPGEQSVYVIADEPVLISWGGTAAGRHRDLTPAANAKAHNGIARWALPLLGLLLLAGLAFTGWWWYQQWTGQNLRAALESALESAQANQCQPTAPLTELSNWLDRIDPEAEDHPDIRMAVLTETGLCEEAAGLAQGLAAATDCAGLSALDATLSAYDQQRQPFRHLRIELDQRLSACRRVQDLESRLAAAGADCTAVAALDLEVRALAGQAYPLADLRHGLDQALSACRLAGELQPRIDTALGDCQPLRNLARETAGLLADLDTTSPPLAGIAETIAAGLTRCNLADYLEQELARSQGDCAALTGLKETLARDDPSREPLAAIQRRLAVALGQCKTLTDLEQRYAQSQGDCTRLRALEESLGQYRTNLRFLAIRTRVRQGLEVCDQASAVEDQIGAAGDCAKVRALGAELKDQGDPRFAKAQAALKGRLTDCDRLDRYTRLLAEAGQDCTRLKALERDLGRESARSLRPILQRLEQALIPCRPKPPPPVIVAPKPKPAPAPEPKTDTRPIAVPKPRPAPPPPPVPKGSGTFAMRGDCQGRLTISPSAGWNGDGVRHTVTIDPPGSARVARVTSSNRGCRNCQLSRVGGNTWRGDFWYVCSGRGIVPVSYSAYDAQGKLICSGSGSDLCLGRR